MAVTESDPDLKVRKMFYLWPSKEMSHDFVRGQFVAETCFIEATEAR